MTNEETIEGLRAELTEAKKDAASWKSHWQMYRNAWVRELGGWAIPKAHEIDSLVLTTRKRCVNPLLGNCITPHWLGKPTADRKALVQTPHPRESSCKDWKFDDSGAAVSASPQPRCKVCNGSDLIVTPFGDFLLNIFCNGCGHEMRYEHPCDLRTLVGAFFAAAPAQEPRQVRNLDEIDESHIAAQEQPVENSPQLDDSRCAICGWPLAESVEKGCTRGNCSMRPFPDNIYDPARANKEYKTERFTTSPQKGKP